MLVHLMHIEELEQSGLSAPLESALVWTHVGSIEDCLGFLLFHVEGTHHLLDRSFVMRTVIVVIRPSSPCISLSLRRDYASVYRIQSGDTGLTGSSIEIIVFGRLHQTISYLLILLMLPLDTIVYAIEVVI